MRGRGKVRDTIQAAQPCTSLSTTSAVTGPPAFTNRPSVSAATRSVCRSVSARKTSCRNCDSRVVFAASVVCPNCVAHARDDQRHASVVHTLMSHVSRLMVGNEEQ